jgi:F0F1-type ATP synthase alpha subunit
VVLGDYKTISEGDTVKTTGRILEVPVGRELPAARRRARPPDRRQGPAHAKSTAAIERVAGVISTGRRRPAGADRHKAVDAMVPIGRGQRELIIGDRQTGKTALAIDTIINQEELRHQMRLRRHRPEAELDRQRGAQARRARRDGADTIVVAASASVPRPCSTCPPTRA